MDNSKAKGILCIVASAFGFALMAFFVRLCDDFGGPVSCFQKGFFRNVVAFAIALCVFVRNSHEVGVRLPSRSAYPALLARCLFGSFGIFANFYAISHIQVGEAMALNKTAPFFTVLFSWLLLGEKATWRQLSCLVLAFAGAMLVVKPGFRTADMTAAFLGLASGLGAGIAYACVHKLGRMKVAGSFIVLAFSGFSCIASVPFAVLDFRPMTVAQILILLGAGAGAAMGQFGITAAYRFAEPRAIAAYDYTGVVFSALFGFAFFGQVPDAASVAGFAVILLCAMRIRGSGTARRSNVVYYTKNSGGSMEEKIKAKLEELRVGLQNDGGDLELVKIDGKVVYLKLVGHCGSCPFAMMTLKQGIEVGLQEIDPEITVERVE